MNEQQFEEAREGDKESRGPVAIIQDNGNEIHGILIKTELPLRGAGEGKMIVNRRTTENQKVERIGENPGNL